MKRLSEKMQNLSFKKKKEAVRPSYSFGERSGEKSHLNTAFSPIFLKEACEKIFRLWGVFIGEQTKDGD